MTAEEEFLDELRDFLSKWNAELEAHLSSFGQLSLRYFVVKADQQFEGTLPHCLNETNVTAKKENND